VHDIDELDEFTPQYRSAEYDDDALRGPHSYSKIHERQPEGEVEEAEE
jgi:hypothetical protein